MKGLILWLLIVTITDNISGQLVLTVKKGLINTTSGQLIKFRDLTNPMMSFFFISLRLR